MHPESGKKRATRLGFPRLDWRHSKSFAIHQQTDHRSCSCLYVTLYRVTIPLFKEGPGTPTHPLPDGESERLITPSSATTSATKTLATLLVAQSEAGRGELNNAASWDDFPNGRFGDFKSPAFGDQDLWGGSHFSVWCNLHNNILVPNECTVRKRKLYHNGVLLNRWKTLPKSFLITSIQRFRLPPFPHSLSPRSLLVFCHN